MEPKSYRDSLYCFASNGTKNQFFFTHTVNPPQYFSNRKANCFPSGICNHDITSKSSWLIYFPYQGLKISLLKKVSKKRKSLKIGTCGYLSLFFHFRRKGPLWSFLDPVIKENYIPSFKLKNGIYWGEKALHINISFFLFILPFPGSPSPLSCQARLKRV